MWSHKSKFWKGFWGCRGLKLGMIHGTLPAVIGFCRWQVKALLRLINTWRPPFCSKHGHSRKYLVKVLTLEEVVENWRDFGRNQKIGSNETKNNGWFDSILGKGVESENFSLCGRQQNIGLLRLTSMTKKIQYVEVKPQNGNKVHIFKQK